MKNLVKYCSLASVLLLTTAVAQADITVKDTVTPEFIHNQGYSKEVSRVIDVKTKDPLTPIAQEEHAVRKNFKYYLWEFIDPAVDRPGNWVEHDVKFSNSIDDL